MQQRTPHNVWAIANGKGGVGKTTLTATLGQLAAADGRRVLIVDLDPQGTMAYDLGYDADPEGGVELFDAVARRRRLEPTFCDVRSGLDVIAAGNDTHALGVWLASQPRSDSNGPYRLAQAIGSIAGDYDRVLIDCPPGERALQEAALVAARWLLIPTNADAGSQAGLHQMAARFNTALEANPDLGLAGVVLTFVPASAGVIRDQAMTEIIAAFGGDSDYLCKSAIRYAVKPAVTARGRGITVPELAAAAPSNETAAKLAADYLALAAELLSVEETH